MENPTDKEIVDYLSNLWTSGPPIDLQDELAGRVPGPPDGSWAAIEDAEDFRAAMAIVMGRKPRPPQKPE